MKKSRVLIVAGSDSGGGAGIQGDIKTVTALGGYAATAITALTAQNTQGVFGIHEVPGDFIAQQMRLVLDDIGADAIKTGMLHNAGVIEAVATVLAEYPDIPLVLDPVMVAKGGSPLLQPDAVALLIKKLIPRATLITPNVPEAELLLECVKSEYARVRGGASYDDPAGESERSSDRGSVPPEIRFRVAGREDMEKVGKQLLAFGCKAVLMKGGHLTGDEVTDMLLATRNSQLVTHCFTSPRIDTLHTHGTGCTLASAIATGIAQGLSLNDAVIRARRYVQEAIRTAPGLGKGHGPLNHGHTIKALQ